MSASDNLRIAADENFSAAILEGLIRRLPRLDALTVQQAGLQGANDTQVLEWAASENRILLTHDWRTMPRHAMNRVERGQLMPGVIVVPRSMPIGQAIEEVELVLGASLPGELNGRLVRLPLER
ncbi:MAG: DUF5615 family PIN-like protein [Fimbriimonadales bacterium]|nr:DUF5615 family PIN-like protein [Fimbriimonadales bacterium]